MSEKYKNQEKEIKTPQKISDSHQSPQNINTNKMSKFHIFSGLPEKYLKI